MTLREGFHPGTDEVMTLTSAVQHSGGAVQLGCTEAKGNFDVNGAS